MRIHSYLSSGSALTQSQLPEDWEGLTSHRSMEHRTKEALLIAVKTIAMTCTMPRVKIEYLTAELVVAVTRTIRRCLWDSATVAKARWVQCR